MNSMRFHLLSLTLKLRYDILEGLAEEIRYTAYPKDEQFQKVAEALIKTHPCLREKGTQVWVLWMEALHRSR